MHSYMFLEGLDFWGVLDDLLDLHILIPLMKDGHHFGVALGVAER